MGMTGRDIEIGLMAALQESSLRNLSYGHLDSVGLFQQRASWGSFKQRTDPRWSTAKFFSRLKGVSGRERMPMWQAAQSVQISANGKAYDRWESAASFLFGEYGGSVSTDGPKAKRSQTLDYRPTSESVITRMLNNPQTMDFRTYSDPILQAKLGNVKGSMAPMAEASDWLAAEGQQNTGGPVGGPAASPVAVGAQAADKQVDFSGFRDLSYEAQVAELDAETAGMFQDYLKGSGSPATGQAGNAASGVRADVLATAKKYIGTPYVFGGNSTRGFDCSSLVQYTLKQFGIDAPRLAYQQARWGEQTSISKIRPGDLVFWGNSSRTQGNHIAFYLGNNMILEAPRPGLSVRIRKLGQWDEDDNAIGVKLPY